MSAKRVLGVTAVFGLAAGIAYWIYLKISDPDNAPSASDLLQNVISYFRRGYLIVSGKVTSSDPVAIAAGFIAQQESFSAKAYSDPPGQTETYSIGYGHQIVQGDPYDSVPPNNVISESDANALLQADLQSYVDCVNNATGDTQLSSNQLAALYDFCYNEGCAAFTGSSLLKDILAGNFGNIQADLDLWDKVHINGVLTEDDGLLARRHAEATLFSA